MVTGMGTLTERSGRRGHNWTWNRGRERPARSGGQRRRRTKNRTLLGDVQEYRGFYAGEGNDKVWNLKYS